ncbi:hypothetical protein ILYODFUR_037778 [Ilyodon furcidens]|uniref:Uncharacterized protein n=1 Tax=Ilyodon furcidens TaxID=33524 RepID=A0ABV0TFP6_9TELE
MMSNASMRQPMGSLFKPTVGCFITPLMSASLMIAGDLSRSDSSLKFRSFPYPALCCMHAPTNFLGTPINLSLFQTKCVHLIEKKPCRLSLSDELTPPSYFPMCKGIAQSSSPSNGSGLP